MDSNSDQQTINNGKRNYAESNRALYTLIILLLAGLAGIVIFALQTSNVSQFFSVATIGLMVAGASLLIGGLLGFLFGIPRTLQQDRMADINTTSTDSEEQKVNYQANTNLEQISDWLTKILVGVGLTQIMVIPGKLELVANKVAVGLGGAAGSNIFAISVILFFTICGFLFGYLWTRLFLPGAFRQADLSILVNTVEKARQEVTKVNLKLQEVEKQAERDATALSLTYRQLNPVPDIPPVTNEQLIETIKNASRSVKVQIFNQAQDIRKNNWKENKEQMALTVPLFQALIVDDTDGEYHRNHAQLGFALKDLTKPDWSQAEKELSKAIDLRGPWEDNGWLIYEFNRAVCRINMDEGFKSGKPSSPEVIKKIIEDLHAANQSDLKKLIQTDQDINKWLGLNGLTRRNLT